MQFNNKYYHQHYLSRGTWLDAERVCHSGVDSDGHLWSVNSYTEWWNIVHKAGSEFIRYGSSDKIFVMHDDFLLATLSFIGLQRYAQVSVSLVKVIKNTCIMLLYYFLCIKEIGGSARPEVRGSAEPYGGA